ncbi:C-GCAxxG-C-C family protein [Absicoccus intestinalis]|uniref:C-GCAxxG-C-C family protein n=1 Tax=Absicoccus intestinalis TaxID=2926319 RepID=A0ABU4WI68_9FIRM|nr:C-GCAxxG-C-C family protein [Absicoccus sp. CLA-KB-P134]MDX8416256.1 C-GCAxxG-C-C family protein [Absicoccus sp. CLA-KB-P134]
MKEPSEELIEQIAHDFTQEHMMCSQVTFAYAAKKLGYDVDTAKHMASIFGGGMMNGERCGALTGALMGLGLKYGHSGPEDKANEQTLQAKKKALEAAFMDQYHSLLCKDVIGANFGTPEGQKKIQEEQLTKNCPLLTARVCMLLDELL